MRLIHIFVLVIVYLCLVEGYRTFSMKDLKSCSKPVDINISSMRRNSTGILVYALDKTYEPGLHCEVILRPPLAYGIVVSIRYLDLQPFVGNYTVCGNYLEILRIGHRDSKAVRLCGYSYDENELQSYTHWGRTHIVFHTSTNSSKTNKAIFQLTFTAIRKGNNWCFGEERRCHNGHCIWKGLTCDGHNNCGDASDELDKFVSQCGMMSSGESLAVILITIAGSLILLIIAAYLKGPKITQQIERLSATRCTSAQSVASEPSTIRNNTVAAISQRNNHGATANLLSPFCYEAVIDDPPPSYAEVVGLPENTIGNAVSRDHPSGARNTIIAERHSTDIYRSQS